MKRNEHCGAPHQSIVVCLRAPTHLCLGVRHDFAEGPSVPECVEDVAEGAAEYALNDLSLVTSLQQVLQGADDGQASTNSALEVKGERGGGVV